MAKSKWKKILWPKKTSRKALMVCLYVACIYLVLGGFGIVPLIATPTGFLTVSVNNVNGYARGTSVGGNSIGYGESGYLYIPADNGVMIRAYVQIGNVKNVNQTWLGWQQVANTSISATKYYFTFNVLAWTVDTSYDTMPTGTGTVSLLQYGWYRHGLFGDVIDSAKSYLKINYLTVPSNWYDRLNTAFYLDACLEFTCDPTLFGQNIPLTIDESTGTYSAVGFAVTGLTLNADPLVASTGGIVTQPTINYNNDTLKVSTTTAEVVSGASTPGAASNNNNPIAEYSMTNIEAALYAADGLSGSNHFTITTSSGTASAGTAQYQSLLGAGMPVTLTSNETSTITDYSQVSVLGTVPFLLQPQTSIDRTQYTYKEWSVQSYDKWFAAGVTSASYTTKNPSYITKVGVKNVWAIQQFVMGVTTATNYTFNPIDSVYTGNVTAPVIDGLDGSLDPLPTDYVSAAGGTINAPNIFDGILDFFGPIGIWIVVIILIMVAAVLVWRFAKPGKRKR